MATSHRYGGGVRGAIAKYFKMKDDSTESYLQEFVGGLTNYLVCVYILDLGPVLQAGADPQCATYGNVTMASGYTCDQQNSMAVSFALIAGIGTILMGVVAGVPFVLAPGISYSSAFQEAATAMDPSTVLAANIIVGSLIILFGATSLKTRIIHVMPEDYRLGISAGIGGFLALNAVRLMNVVPADTTTFVTTFSYKTILSLVGVIVIAVIQSLQKGMASWAFILSIVIVTVISVIIRASVPGADLIVPPNNSIPSLSIAQSFPSFAQFDLHDFTVFKYIVLQTVTKLFDLVGTVTALILLAVISRLGYSKETFLDVLSESEKVMRIYLVDGFCNTLLAPLIGTSILTVFIETAAGIVAGARTGLASVITGSLFLISCLFARAIATIIPSEASGGVILVACFLVIKGLQYIDYERTPRSVPALMGFVLIPFTSSIAVGASFSFIVLFAIWALTPNIVKIRTQMVFTFSLSVLLLVVETQLVNDSITMGAVLCGLCAFSIICSLTLNGFHDRLKQLVGDSAFDSGSSKPTTGTAAGPSHPSKRIGEALTQSFKHISGKLAPSATVVSSAGVAPGESRVVETTMEEVA